MSMALDDVCAALKLRDGSAKEVIAARIIDLARRGERSPTRLRNRVLYEAGLAGLGLGSAIDCAFNEKCSNVRSRAEHMPVELVVT